MSERLRELDRLKAAYEASREALDSARATGDLNAIDEARLALQDREEAYFTAIYERAPGMSGDDRTAAAKALAADHEARYQAMQREQQARIAIDDLGQEINVDMVEEYEAARDARRELGLPEPEDAWVLDLTDERARVQAGIDEQDWERERLADREREAFEGAKREGFDGWTR